VEARHEPSVPERRERPRDIVVCVEDEADEGARGGVGAAVADLGWMYSQSVRTSERRVWISLIALAFCWRFICGGRCPIVSAGVDIAGG